MLYELKKGNVPTFNDMNNSNKKAIKSIILCSSNYPTETDSVCPFVEQIVNALSLKGIKVTVVAPQSIVKHWLRGTELHPKKRVYTYQNGLPITVYQPTVLSFGGRFERWNSIMRDKAVYRTLKKNRVKADICYGHFWHHAFSLYKYAKKNTIPLFAVSGEAHISCHEIKKPYELAPFIDYVKGLICVSNKNRDESLEVGLLIDEGKCKVIPNAIDNTLFRVLDKQSLREKHGIRDEDFVVAFTGWYDHNKGVMRVSDAIKKIGDSNIKSFFIGDGRDGDGLQPDCDGILHKGRLAHEKIPEYLNMADVFVLPTLAEGCNNAIIEAMACGLPIISSNRSFNWDVLNEKNSILVDPMNVDEIASAIKTLKENKKKRDAMSRVVLETAAGLTIDKRAEKIISFIESRI